MSALSFERLAYEFDEIWDEDWFPVEDFERVRALAAMVPEDSSTLLDVGCGSGLFLNHLRRHYPSRFARLAGVDRSEAALARVQTEIFRSGVEQLPFDDAEFDTVTCMEVLEHLPDVVYEHALLELARVAKQWIVVSVPYDENLAANRCVCPSCATSFHPDYHVRSFDEGSLRSLFHAQSFEVVKTHYLGARIERYDHAARNRIREILRGDHRRPVYPSYAICPACGFHDRAALARDLACRKAARRTALHEPAVEGRVSSIRSAVRRVLPKRVSHRWIAATYSRSPARRGEGR